MLSTYNGTEHTLTLPPKRGERGIVKKYWAKASLKPTRANTKSYSSMCCVKGVLACLLALLTAKRISLMDWFHSVYAALLGGHPMTWATSVS